MSGPTDFWLEDDLAAAVDAIAADTAAGPVAAARRGVDVVLQMVAKEYYERPLQINLEIQGLGRALLRARPDSVPLAHLASDMASPLQEFYGRGRDEGARMRADLRARAEAWLARLDERARLIVAQAADLMPAQGAIITPDRQSATILAALRIAMAAGKQPQVLLWRVGASPSKFSDQVASLGVRTALVGANDSDDDAARGTACALVSAHAVDREGAFVPTGVGRLVAAVHSRAVPCYLIAGPEKLVPSNYSPRTASMPAGLEVVPLAAWSGFLVGDAMLSSDGVESAIASMRLESTLL